MSAQKTAEKRTDAQVSLFRRALRDRLIQPGQPVTAQYLLQLCRVRSTAQESHFAAALERRNLATYDRKSDQFTVDERAS